MAPEKLAVHNVRDLSRATFPALSRAGPSVRPAACSLPAAASRWTETKSSSVGATGAAERRTFSTRADLREDPFPFPPVSPAERD